MPGSSSPAKATPRSTAIHSPAALGAEAVEREIHADLADAAERRKDELVAGVRHQRRSPRPARDDVAGGDRLAAAVRQRQHQPPGLVDVVEAPDQLAVSARRTRICSPRPAARASQSARMVEKCSPSFHCASRPSILADSAANSASAVTAAPAAVRSVAG